MFSEELEKIDWEKITKAIYSKTEHDVLRALGKEHCDVDDFMGTVIRWGSDKFKTWEEIIGYFELLGGQ